MSESLVRLVEMLEDLEAKHKVRVRFEIIDASTLERDPRKPFSSPVEGDEIDVETGIVERHPRVIAQELVDVAVGAADLDDVRPARAHHRSGYGTSGKRLRR